MEETMQILELLSKAVWLIPVGFIGVFYLLEEKAWKEELKRKIDVIHQKKICHAHAAPHGDKTVCKPTLVVLIKQNQNEQILNLYFVHHPRVVRYLNSLQLRNLALYFAAVFVLLIAMYLLKMIPPAYLSQKTVEIIQSIISTVGLISLVAFAIVMWYKRFVPIRSFCDEVEKIKD